MCTRSIRRIMIALIVVKHVKCTRVVRLHIEDERRCLLCNSVIHLISFGSLEISLTWTLNEVLRVKLCEYSFPLEFGICRLSSGIVATHDDHISNLTLFLTKTEILIFFNFLSPCLILSTFDSHCRGKSFPRLFFSTSRYISIQHAKSEKVFALLAPLLTFFPVLSAAKFFFAGCCCHSRQKFESRAVENGNIKNSSSSINTQFKECGEWKWGKN